MSTVKLGVLGGSGNAELPGLQHRQEHTVQTRFGAVSVTEGVLAGVAVAHVSRHGPAHERLSNHLNHRANLDALRAVDVTCAVGLTVCGAVDPDVALGSLIVFDDLFFPSNRLPDGELCTWHTGPGAPGRGHWIFEHPFSDDLRRALLDGASAVGAQLVSAGVYGHVDGPRFNTRSEIAMLRAVGVCAVSQTGGPETVLAGEAELPYALLGYVTDYANGVTETAEPVEALLIRMSHSAEVLAAVLEKTVSGLNQVNRSGVVHRFGP